MLFGAVPPARGQINEHLRVHRSTDRRQVTFVAAERGRSIPVEPGPGRLQAAPIDFFHAYGKLFGIERPSEQLREAESRTDALGHAHTTFFQVHEGIPVFSGMLKVHRDARGNFLAANGNFYPLKPGFDVWPRISPKKAANAAAMHAGTERPRIELVELVIVDPGWYGDRSLGPRLAYHVRLSDIAVPWREAFFVDAHSGEWLDQWSTLHTERFRITHDYTAGSDCCIEHDSVGCSDLACEASVCEDNPECCDLDWTITCAVRAAGGCAGLCIPGPEARIEGELPTGTPDVDALYDYLGDAYEYFARAFGRDGLDDRGLVLRAVAHWGFGCPNAFWDDELLLAVFCPGVAPDDVVAHELTHGLTQFTTNLIYQNQPGQLNESFSDVFGELVDLFNGGAELPGSPTGTPWEAHTTGPGGDAPNPPRTRCSPIEEGHPDGVRWLVSEDAISSFGGPIRDMWDPTCFGDPDRANSPLQTCSIIDNGGVHSGSGIPNHAFALLTDGGDFNGYQVRGIGPVKSGAVWYRALTTYLTVASDFEASYPAFNQAAQDLIGAFLPDPRTGLTTGDMFTADDAEQVDRALKAVEMNTPGRCGRVTPALRSDPPGRCFDAELIFEDAFESGVNGWTTENSGPPTPYDWVQRDQLPGSRPGHAWFVADPSIGDCVDQDETAVHALISPPIPIPSDAGVIYLSFDHYVETEPAWDGGQLRVRVNGGTWQHVPPVAIEFNPYNALLRSADPSGNTNPLAGQAAWSGFAGAWGTSLVNLQGLAAPGDTLQVRFDFGKDGCTGFDGWYVDDFAVYRCGDCNADGLTDEREIRYAATSGLLAPFGVNSWQTMTLVRPPRAIGPVTVRIFAAADLASESEFVTVRLNLIPAIAGRAFIQGGSDCPATPDGAIVTIPRDMFNEARKRGNVHIHLIPSVEVSSGVCRHGTYVQIQVEYQASGDDADGSRVLDVCEGCAPPAVVLPEMPVLTRNRYLSIVPGSPDRLTALRVRIEDAPGAYAALNGAEFWVDRPTLIAETADQLVDSTGEQSFFTARLTCAPVYFDFGSLGSLHIFDATIIPGARYLVSAVDFACQDPSAADFSDPLALATGSWGDVSGLCNADFCRPPDQSVDITDVVSVLDKFTNQPYAIAKTRADLAGAVPNRLVDMADAAVVLDAFQGSRFDLAVPAVCPPE